jgi:iron(III) transport system ATP-binding protein
VSAIEIRGLSKAYGATPVLRSVDLDVPEASITAVLGASGSGKTTLLRVIAGFEDADAGRVTIGGQLVDDGHRTVRPQHRGVGYVPQDAALFPHLTVAANIGFGVPRGQRAGLGDLIELVGLTGYERRYPHQLSGGQQQRVALARAFAIRPRVVLLDEPFGALDAALRESVRAEVIGILAQTATTTVLVTHDQDEALSVADHIALLDDGAVLAHGRPSELYDHPPTPQIATAIGTANILTGHISGGGVECALGRFAIDGAPAPAGSECRVMVRPEQLEVSPQPGDGRTAATVVRLRYHGHDTLIDLAARDGREPEFVARVTGNTTLTPGQPVWLSTLSAPHLWPDPGTRE